MFISIHAPREGCDRRLADIDKAYDVFQSTHPVRGATYYPIYKEEHRAISIHAPREGCDIIYGGYNDWTYGFQSTHPVRGATKLLADSGLSTFQSTHPVRGATVRFQRCITQIVISIHAPRVGCDTHDLNHRPAHWVFQSTHPVRGATITRTKRHSTIQFQSTHPVRGATAYPFGYFASGVYFNPRTP